MEPPTPAELGPLLGDTNGLDDAPPEADGDTEDGEFEAAAMSAVGTRQKASALKDAILACLRSEGLLKESAQDEADESETEPSDDESSSSAGAGFGDY